MQSRSAGTLPVSFTCPEMVAPAPPRSSSTFSRLQVQRHESGPERKPSSFHGPTWTCTVNAEPARHAPEFEATVRPGLHLLIEIDRGRPRRIDPDRLHQDRGPADRLAAVAKLAADRRPRPQPQLPGIMLIGWEIGAGEPGVGAGNQDERFAGIGKREAPRCRRLSSRGCGSSKRKLAVFGGRCHDHFRLRNGLAGGVERRRP